jgi:hypothetical protein
LRICPIDFIWQQLTGIAAIPWLTPAMIWEIQRDFGSTAKLETL